MEGIADLPTVKAPQLLPSTGSYRNAGEVGFQPEEEIFLWTGTEQIGDLEPSFCLSHGTNPATPVPGGCSQV